MNESNNSVYYTGFKKFSLLLFSGKANIFRKDGLICKLL